MDGSAVLDPYVPNLATTWLREQPSALWREVHGSLAFVDISGFTQLTERLAREGKVGAERMSDILNATFADLLQVAYRDAASLVKWGGDAVLLLFQGEEHAVRAARAAHRMRARLRRIGRVSTPSGLVTLRMSVGIHSGTFHFFLVGDPAIHRELVVSGPAASATADVEARTAAGEIGLTPQTAALLAPALVGGSDGDLRLLVGEPRLADLAPVPRVPSAGIDLASLIPPPIRAHLQTSAGEPEHRQIAVAFVQFSGTDALLAQEGPAALAGALDECVRNVQHAAERHGVTFFESDINRDGGKIMLTAGAPLSSDHHEERLLRAARQIVDRFGTLPLRIGLNCGPVFAGDFGPPFRRTYSVKGDAINLAARVLGKAQPGQLLATADALARSARQFDVEPLPPFHVKGKSAPVDAASVGILLESAHGVQAPDTALVGRADELATLLAALDRARSGRGSVVELSGPPGIGKTRLVQELLRTTDLDTFVSRCDEYETATAYWPFRTLLREVLRVPAGEGPDAAADELRTAAERLHPAVLPWLPLVARVVDADLPSTSEVDALADEFRKARLEQATIELLQRLLTEPAVLVFDSAHLMDDASADLLEQLCRGVGERPWLVVVTRRDADDGFTASEGYEVVRVRPTPLDTAGSAALAAQVLGEVALPAHAVAAITARAGGNPLFLRGLVLAARAGTTVDALPATVEALITSQIDRLPARERTVLRFASVLGSTFQESDLRALLRGRAVPTGPGALRRLSYFLRPQGHGRYGFEHQLVRDTAYEGLPYRTRRDLHGRAGEILELASPHPEDLAELLSLHYYHANRPEKAWYYSRIGGDRASAKYAYVEAEELLGRAAQVARALPGLPDHDIARVNGALGEARFRLGRAPQALEAFRAARTRLRSDPLASAGLLKLEAETYLRMGRLSVALRTLTRGLHLLDGLDSAPALTVRSRLEGGYAVVRENQGRYRDALSWARRAEQHAEESGDAAALADALQAIHASFSLLGVAPDRPYGEEALALYEQLGDRGAQSRSLNNLAVQSWIQGRGQDALEMFRRAEQVAVEAGDTVGAAATRYNIGDALLHLGRAREAQVLLRPLVPLLRTLGIEDFHATARRALGLALVLADEPAEGRVLLAEARALLVDLGESAEVVETDAAIATSLLTGGRCEAAAELAADAAARATALEAGYLQPWLLRLEGAALADAGHPDRAEAVLSRALVLAGTQNRIELGFILAELAALARRRSDPTAANDLARRSQDALRELGFVGSARYPCT